MPITIIYARKSTESEDRQVLSIDSQIHELRALAARQGLNVAEVLTESRSAKAPGRAIFGDLMRRIHRGQIAHILCWKMDRLARNHLDTGQVLQALADSAIVSIITPERTYTSDGNDRFLGNFELGIATKFIDDLRSNVKRGIRARLQRGWANYVPPLGYLNDRVAKTIITDPERFAVLRGAWELLLSGAWLPRQIRHHLNVDLGFRTTVNRRGGGGPVTRSAFYSMFSNPFYMGIIRLRTGETYQGAHEPMVSPEEFQRAQDILGRTGRPRPVRHTFSFSGFLTCRGCAGTITAEEHIKKSGKRYVYYRCSRNKGSGCREPAMPERRLEAELCAALEGMTMPPKLRAWLDVQLAETLRSEAGRVAAGRATIEASLTALERESNTLLSLRLKDLLDDAEFARRTEEHQERRATLQVQLNRPQRSNAELHAYAVQAMDFAARAAEVFRTGTLVQKRQILESVCLNSSMHHGKSLTLLKKPFSIMAERSTCPDWYRLADELRTYLMEDVLEPIPDLDKLEAQSLPPAIETIRRAAETHM